MKNSDLFLVAFNSIEMSLKEYNMTGEYLPFSRLIQIAKKSNAVIRKYYDDLKEFSELRNAIVHNSIDVKYAIAEPHDKIVEKIQLIEREINEPQKIIPLFQRKVVSFQSNNTLRDMLIAINHYSFSKFPIYDKNKFIGLLTKKGIVNWLASNSIKFETISTTDIILKNILRHENENGNYKFVDRNKTIYDVKEVFKEIDKNNPRIDALLITEHGKANEAIIGIITPEDIVNYD